MEIAIEVSLDEWERVMALRPIIENEETSGLGQVRLTCSGGRRRWSTTDSIRALFFEVESNDPDVDVGLSPSLLPFFYAAAHDRDSATVTVTTVRDRAMIGIEGPGGRMQVYDMGHGFPDLRQWLIDGDRVGGVAQLSGETLRLLVHTSMIERVTDDEGNPTVTPLTIGFDDGRLTAKRTWEGLGSSWWWPATTRSTGDIVIDVDPRLVLSVARCFPDSADLELRFPVYNTDPLVITDGDLVAFVMPIKTDRRVLSEQVEATLKEVCGHLAIIRDDDGDYPLARRGTPIFARLVHDIDPPTLQVFAVALSDVEPSPELLTELNDLNSSSTYARIFFVDDQVLVEADLVAETLDEHELRTAMRRIREIATEVVPMLSAVFGGVVEADPAGIRLGWYRSTVVEAEVLPGLWTTINGPSAVADWPFPGPVWVITGWNPQGVALAQDEHENVNRQIAHDILDRGGRFVFGQGRSPDGEHSEPSLIAWGITREDARDMGARASQDCVFEISATEMLLLSCVNDSIDAWGRLE